MILYDNYDNIYMYKSSESVLCTGAQEKLKKSFHYDYKYGQVPYEKPLTWGHEIYNFGRPSVAP